MVNARSLPAAGFIGLIALFLLAPLLDLLGWYKPTAWGRPASTANAAVR